MWATPCWQWGERGAPPISDVWLGDCLGREGSLGTRLTGDQHPHPSREALSICIYTLCTGCKRKKKPGACTLFSNEGANLSRSKKSARSVCRRTMKIGGTPCSSDFLLCMFLGLTQHKYSLLPKTTLPDQFSSKQLCILLLPEVAGFPERLNLEEHQA